MRIQLLLPLLSLLFLSGCITPAKNRAIHIDTSPIPSAKKAANTGYFKVGSPYRIAGKRYTPRERYSYSQTGIASWYGPNFHGKKTANGEIFDMYELTAAHKTLQIPSIVRVTNLENGKSLIVRINDRGPFKDGRIIDLSKRSAELLGMKNKGTAKVKIQVLPEESRRVAAAAKRGESTNGVEVAFNRNPTAPVLQSSARARGGLQSREGERAAPTPLTYKTASNEGANMPALDGVRSSQRAQISEFPAVIEREALPARAPAFKSLKTFEPVARQVPVLPSNIYVQAGSFSENHNAQRLAQSLQKFGEARVYPTQINGKSFYRVRIGPMRDVAQADGLLTKMASAGRQNTIIIID